MYTYSMKICGKCNLEKSEEEFSWRNKSKGWKMPWCKVCVKAYDAVRSKTEEYRTSKKKQVAIRVEKNQKYVAEYLYKNPCVDCGEKRIQVLDFDHKDDVTKVSDISKMIHAYSLTSIISEIEKCDVRCANCHRIRTHKQFGYWKHVNAQIPVDPMIANRS